MHGSFPESDRRRGGCLASRCSCGTGLGSSSSTAGPPGIDRSFAEACGELGIDQEAHPARWEALDVAGAVIRYRANRTPYNANTVLIRNAEMVALGADMCLAFHRALSSSRGTKDCVGRALAAGIPAYLIDSEGGEPRRLRAGDARLG